jgi:uncharacterized protein YggE
MRIHIAAIYVVLVAMNVCPALSQEVQTYGDRRIITVTGEARVYAEPDKVVVMFGIETWNSDILNAKLENNEIVKKTLTLVKELGILQKDIQTDRLSINPTYKDRLRYTNQYNEIEGYLVINSLVITLTEVNKIEELVTKALQSGVNHIMGLEFQTNEYKTYREQARELALKAAKEKAEKMSHVLDQSVGEPIQIREEYTGSSGSTRRMDQVQVYNFQYGDSEISETIALGKISIRAVVTVTFELK